MYQEINAENFTTLTNVMLSVFIYIYFFGSFHIK